jgi:transposase-like protein
MNNTATQTERRRRSRAEVATLVAGFVQSGLSRTEYCRQHGLSLSTLNRHRKGASDRSGIKSGLVTHASPAVSLIPVDVMDSELAHKSPRIALCIELSGGRRIGVDAGFDAETLRRLIAVLEAA